MRLVSLVAAVLLLTRAGHADEPARIKFDAGRRYLELGQYAEAIQEFESGAEVAPASKKPLFVLNIGQVYRRWGKLRKARSYYLRYLQIAPADAAERPTTRDLLSEVEAELVAHPEAEEPPPRVTPPTAIVAPPPPAAPPPPPPTRSVSPLPWIIAAVGIAAIGGGVTCGILSGQRRQAAADEPVQTAAFADFTDAQHLASASNGLTIGGGILAAAGLVWGIIDLVRGRKSEPLSSVARPWRLAW